MEKGLGLSCPITIEYLMPKVKFLLFLLGDDYSENNGQFEEKSKCDDPLFLKQVRPLFFQRLLLGFMPVFIKHGELN